MNNIMKCFIGLIIIIIIIFGPELLDNIYYKQYKEDCNPDESFQEKSWITGIGICVPSAESEFCESVKRCIIDGSST